MKLKTPLAEQREIPRQPLANFTDAADVETTQRLGFLIGTVAVPDDFDQMGQAEIKNLFEA
jgi:hypothetical protein